jgi:hypothetical protein
VARLTAAGSIAPWEAAGACQSQRKSPGQGVVWAMVALVPASGRGRAYRLGQRGQCAARIASPPTFSPSAVNQLAQRQACASACPKATVGAPTAFLPTSRRRPLGQAAHLRQACASACAKATVRGANGLPAHILRQASVPARSNAGAGARAPTALLPTSGERHTQSPAPARL